MDELLNHLNSVRPSIKFTVELEKDGTLPFLDTLLRRKEGGGLDVKSGRTLRTMLTKVKDTLPTEKHSRVVYRVPCSCGQVYIGETVRRLETRMKEHQDACRRGMVERSAIAEHAWENQHPIKWEETEIVDQARRPKELLLKEALHIQMTPAEERFNRDAGLELPGCWTATLRRLQGGAGSGRPLTSRDIR